MQGEQGLGNTLSHCEREEFQLEQMRKLEIRERVKKAAFTLAEVLITLGIIGVVAAMTIPNLMALYQKKVTATRLKKTYSVLVQAIKMSVEENGGIEGWDKDLSALEYTQRYFVPYLKVTTLVENGANTTAYYPIYSRSNESWKPQYYLWEYSFFPGPILYLLDGTVIKVVNRAGYGINSAIIVDLNGQSRPNKLGRDVFIFILQGAWRSGGFGNSIIYGDTLNDSGLGTLIPLGYTYDRETLKQYCKESTGRQAGTTCAALIMLDNWKISKDYPW